MRQFLDRGRRVGVAAVGDQERAVAGQRQRAGRHAQPGEIGEVGGAEDDQDVEAGVADGGPGLLETDGEPGRSAAA